MKPDIKADIPNDDSLLPVPVLPRDRGEHWKQMEPMRLGDDSPRRPPLRDLAAEVAAKSAAFRRGIPAGMLAPLTDLTRAMNCYYSNRMEGSPTLPIDIARALRGNLATGARRDWRREALAHIRVQRWLDGGALDGRAATVEGLREIHRRFCAALPPGFLEVKSQSAGTIHRIVPGDFRQYDVGVSNHFAPSPGAVPRLMARFQHAYENLEKSELLLAAAAMHHRLVWIHPFLDGNGRVSRLMAHAVIGEALESGGVGVWSVSRGLGRDSRRYKSLLGECDLPRRDGDDGRGNLSESALAAFTDFFLRACLDQIAFMESATHPKTLSARASAWAKEKIESGDLPRGADELLRALLLWGELPRGDAQKILGVTDRQARRVSSALVKAGVADSDSTRAPLRPLLPLESASRWMPGIFSE